MAANNPFTVTGKNQRVIEYDSTQIAAKPPAASTFPQLPPSVSVKENEILVSDKPEKSGQAYFPEFANKVYVQQSNEIQRNSGRASPFGGYEGSQYSIDSIGTDKPTVEIDNSSPSQTTVEDSKPTNWPLMISLAGILLTILLFKLKK